MSVCISLVKKYICLFFFFVLFHSFTFKSVKFSVQSHSIVCVFVCISVYIYIWVFFWHKHFPFISFRIHNFCNSPARYLTYNLLLNSLVAAQLLPVLQQCQKRLNRQLAIFHDWKVNAIPSKCSKDPVKYKLMELLPINPKKYKQKILNQSSQRALKIKFELIWTIGALMFNFIFIFSSSLSSEIYKKNLLNRMKLTFNSKTGPRQSVNGEIKNAVKTMANVILFDKSSFSSHTAWTGSESFSYSTGVALAFDLYRWIWFFTIYINQINKNRNYYIIPQNQIHFIDNINDITSRETKHSMGNVNKIDIENRTRTKFIKSSSQQ